MQFPGVALAAAVGRPDAYAGEVPMLFVSAQPGVTIDPLALADFVRENIPEPPARPRNVSVIAEMPVTPIGKIFKPKLREIAASEAARDLLAAEGLKEVSVEAITDPSRGLFLRVKASPGKAEAAETPAAEIPGEGRGRGVGAACAARAMANGLLRRSPESEGGSAPSSREASQRC